MPLLTPDILVCSVGTEIMIKGKPDAEWEAYLDAGGWDREQAAAVAGRFPELVLQRSSEQRPHKVSYKLYAKDPDQASGVINNLRVQLSSAGLETTVIFSGGEDVDILPDRASKGRALAFLLNQIEEGRGGKPPAGVLVAGDSGNDVELFTVPGVLGCVVANAHKELLEWCEAIEKEEQGLKENEAAEAQKGIGSIPPPEHSSRIFKATLDGPGGIREALYHFDLVRSTSQISESSESGKPTEPIESEAIEPQSPGKIDVECAARREAVVHLHTAFERYFNGLGASEEERYNMVQEISGFLDEDFEMIPPSGNTCSRQEFLKWLEEKGWGSRVVRTRSTVESLLSAELSEERVLSGSNTAMNLPTSTDFRIWIDQFTEKKLAPGLYLVTYRELQQRFTPPKESDSSKRPSIDQADSSSSSTRTVRRSSAILRKSGESDMESSGKRYLMVHVHETWEQADHETSLA